MSALFDINEIPRGIPLSNLTAAITSAVVSSPNLNGVWVIAELSDVRSSGGHCYLELIEKNDSGQTIAKLRANIWRSTYNQLRQKFYAATQRDISTGIKALVKGSTTHHSLYGLSFNITDIDPSYTMGDIERLRREIILKLLKEGVSLNNKNLDLPIAPQRIAVISAEGAAGFDDFINHLKGNSEGFVFYPFLFPCVMQGDKVSESIRKALELIESTIDCWDCIAIVRGGGATTDLNGFDDYELARSIATCSIPVIVGIGHERDRNVLDEIAHTSLKTPTAVANFFIDRLREAYESVGILAEKLRTYSADLLRGEERRLSTIHGLIPQLLLRRISDSNSRLQSISAKMPLIAGNRVERERIRITNYVSMLENALNTSILKARQKTENMEALIKVLDPKNTLKRGYSITRVNGKAVKSKNDLKPGDILNTMFPDGEVISKIAEK